MRFLTPEIYESWWGRYGDGSRLDDAYRRYTAYIESLRGTLPDHLVELAGLKGVDDGLIARAHYDRFGRVLTLTLRVGDLPMGYDDLELRYEDAEISPEAETTLAQIARTTRSQRQFAHDVCFHEVDMDVGGLIEHRLLFHPGISFRIRCRQLTWRSTARPDQELPPFRERLSLGEPDR